MPILMSTPSPKRCSNSKYPRIMSSCSPAERLRLRPWLEKMIEEQGIPGLEWIDEKARIVKIPWKHAARHGWQRDKDASLFKEWAIHTKKYDPGNDEPKANPKIWKANFRCAINSLPDIEELKDQGKSKGNDAFKVYRLNPKKPKKRTVSDSGVKKPKVSKTSKTKSRTHMKLSAEVEGVAPRVSISYSNVSVNVIGGSPPPPPYESAIRDNLLQDHHNLPSVTSFQFPSVPYPPPRVPPIPHVTSSVPSTPRVPPIPYVTSSVPNTPCSTGSSIVTSPLSTPSTTPVTTPVFTFPPPSYVIPSALSSMSIKQEPMSPDDNMSDSDGSDMTDEEVIDMVHQMTEESRSNPSSPLREQSPPTEWLTSTLEDKQFFSNVVTTKGDTSHAAVTQSFQSPLHHYPPTSSFCDYPCNPPAAPTPIVKQEVKDESMPSCSVLGAEAMSPHSFEANGYNL